MTELRLVITGTGRCGTQYVRAVLEAAGVECTHEHAFGPEGPRETPVAAADSSWLAVPFLDTLDRSRTALAVTYRPPEAVISSYRRLRFLEDPIHRPFSSFALRHVPNMATELARHGPLSALEQFYRWLNDTALDHRPDVVYRPDRPPWARLAELVDVDPDRLTAAARRVPVNIGHHVPWRTATDYAVTRNELDGRTLRTYNRLEEAAT